MKGRLLVVDDERSMCELLQASLAQRGYEVVWCTSAGDALDLLGKTEFQAIITDLKMRAMNGLELCERITTKHPDMPVIVLTAFGSQEAAVAAMRAGAYDFVTKPVEMDAVELAVRRAVEQRLLRREVNRLRHVVSSEATCPDLIGESTVMLNVRDLVARVVDSDASVLISGETGTGKELVARALHRQGRRSGGPFVAINCAALPEQLLESELFGHARGAFTDAHRARAGLLVESDGGTILLDEIGELAVGLQAKLLRAIEERAVRPVGSTAEVEFDARIVAATNRDLESAVAEGRFREDLLFRIDVIDIAVPPLRARGNDVLLLAQHFLRQFAQRTTRPVVGFSADAAQMLLSYHWPGNVRELRNSIERAVALARYDQITSDDLPKRVRASRSSRNDAADGETELISLEEVERRHIQRVMVLVGDNKTLAAQVLGLDRKTLYRKLERFARTCAFPSS